MKHKLETALGDVSDSYIRDAAIYKKKRRLAPWLGAVAAVLAVALIAGTVWNPQDITASPTGDNGIHTLASEPSATIAPVLPHTAAGGNDALRARAIASPTYPELCGYPLDNDMDKLERWWGELHTFHTQPDDYADSLQSYFASSIPLLLSDTDSKNAVCSPVSIYMALAMLAEVTAGESRQQILELLGADTIETLREQAGHVWRGHYNNDGVTTSILGTSLWLDNAYTCNQETADLLAKQYFASVFHEDLGTEEANTMLRNWLSDQTGGLLDDYVAGIELDPRTALALASSIYYQVMWRDIFEESANTQAVFHGTTGDTIETFMNQQSGFGTYCWGDNFGATSISLEDNSSMWLFLPDEGTTPEQLLSDGEIFDLLGQRPLYADSSYQNRKSVRINLSLPKFDIDSQVDLTEHLQALGVTDVFQLGIADFSPILEEGKEVFVNDVKHAARVAIDENGVTATAYTLLTASGAGAPPDDEVDFILDRPFLFIIESNDGLPLFAGIVNQP